MKILRFVCAAWILPAGFSSIAFFGFFTNYTTDVFSRAGMAAQYERSVFRYRVLGPWLVDAVSTRFEQLSIVWDAPRPFTVMDPAPGVPSGISSLTTKTATNSAPAAARWSAPRT